MRTQFNEWMSTELNHVGAWLKKLGSSQASDLVFVVLPAISQCVKPSCKDRSEQSSAASKSVEREDLQGFRGGRSSDLKIRGAPSVPGSSLGVQE